MNRVVIAAGVVVGMVGAADRAGAQFFPGPGFGGGFYARGRFGVSFGGPNFAVSGFTASVVAYRPYRSTVAPYGMYPVTGWGPPAGALVLAPPPGANWFPAAAPREADAPKVPVNENDFVVIRPAKGAPKLAVNPPVPPRPEAGGPVPAPAPIPAGPVVDAVGDRKADPEAESARQVELAKAAFAAEEYGRAAERLDAAVAAKPDEPLPYFLLAQVRFARGEYAEAVAAVRDGMRAAPDWPAAAFRPKDLYGPHPDRFAAHLAELRRAAADNPADPAPAFLLGYELWFTGERDEAARLFRRVTKQVRDNEIVERFLKEVDGKVGVR